MWPQCSFCNSCDSLISWGFDLIYRSAISVEIHFNFADLLSLMQIHFVNSFPIVDSSFSFNMDRIISFQRNRHNLSVDLPENRSINFIYIHMDFISLSGSIYNFYSFESSSQFCKFVHPGYQSKSLHNKQIFYENTHTQIYQLIHNSNTQGFNYSFTQIYS